MVDNPNTNVDSTMARMENVKDILETQRDRIDGTGDTFQTVCDWIDQSVAGMDRIMAKAGKLEEVRVSTVDVVQDSAALAEENSASMQEIMASIEAIHQRLGSISEKTKDLSGMSQKMKECVDAFSI